MCEFEKHDEVCTIKYSAHSILYSCYNVARYCDIYARAKQQGLLRKED